MQRSLILQGSLSEGSATIWKMGKRKTTVVGLDSQRDAHQIALRARQRSEATAKIYRREADRLIDWLTEEGRSLDPTTVDSRLLDLYFAELGDKLGGTSVGIVVSPRPGLVRWMFAEDEIPSNPFAKMRQPKADDVPPRVLDDEQVMALFKSVSGRTFEDRRDRAILLVLLDTGLRPRELVGLTTEDVDHQRGRLYVTGKTGSRYVALGSTTMEAVERWSGFASPAATPGARNCGWGARTDDPFGVSRRCSESAAPRSASTGSTSTTYATASRTWLSAGGSPNDLQALAGWSSPAMVTRYARATSNDRAVEAHRGGLSPVDRL